MINAGHIVLTILATALILYLLPKLCRLIAKERINNAKIAHDTEIYNSILVQLKAMETAVKTSEKEFYPEAFPDDICTLIRDSSPAITHVAWRPFKGARGTLYIRVEHGSLYFNQDFYIDNTTIGRVNAYLCNQPLN